MFVPGELNMSAAENPILPPKRVYRFHSEEREQVLPSMVANWAWWMGKMQAEIEELFSHGFQRSRHSSEGMISSVQARGRQIRDEQPLALVGVIAGSAFVIGFGLAVWKSRH